MRKIKTCSCFFYNGVGSGVGKGVGDSVVVVVVCKIYNFQQSAMIKK